MAFVSPALISKGFTHSLLAVACGQQIANSRRYNISLFMNAILFYCCVMMFTMPVKSLMSITPSSFISAFLKLKPDGFFRAM